nr:MAG TPA: hypothetical protein [Caudoviricetes sp.]
MVHTHKSVPLVFSLSLKSTPQVFPLPLEGTIIGQKAPIYYI